MKNHTNSELYELDSLLCVINILLVKTYRHIDHLPELVKLHKTIDSLLTKTDKEITIRKNEIGK